MNTININGFWVSLDSYEQAKSIIESRNTIEASMCDVLILIKKLMPDWNIATETKPFNGKGTRNAAIHLAVLQKMAEHPEEMLKYLAYLLDAKKGIAEHESRYRGKDGVELKAHGSIIDGDGNVSSWSISLTENRRAEGRSIIHFPEINKHSWADIMKRHFSRITDANRSKCLLGAVVL